MRFYDELMRELLDDLVCVISQGLQMMHHSLSRKMKGDISNKIIQPQYRSLVATL